MITVNDFRILSLSLSASVYDKTNKTKFCRVISHKAQAYTNYSNYTEKNANLVGIAMLSIP